MDMNSVDSILRNRGITPARDWIWTYATKDYRERLYADLVETVDVRSNLFALVHNAAWKDVRVGEDFQ